MNKRSNSVFPHGKSTLQRDLGIHTQNSSPVFDRIFFLIPGAVLIADLALTGSGRWSEALGFSIRRLMLLIVGGYAILVWTAFFSRIPRGLAAIVGLIFFLLVWGLGIPFINGAPLVNALSDGQLFLGLLLGPALAHMVIRTNCWVGALQLIERLIWMLALLHIALFWSDRLADAGFLDLVSLMRSLLEPNVSVDDETNFYVGAIPGGFRIFWGSSIFLLLGFYLAVRNFGTRRWYINIVILLLVCYAIDLTMTRALVLSIPLLLVLSWLLQRLLIHVRQGGATHLAVGLLLLSLTFPVVLLADPGLLLMIGLGREISDDLRFEQVNALTESILTHPWIGRGLGAHVELIRSEGSPWIYELSMLALYMKVGIFGLIFLLAVFILYGRSAWIEDHKHQPLSTSARKNIARIVALLFCIFFCSNTNPYLFSMLGWGLLIFTYIEFYVTVQEPFAASGKLGQPKTHDRYQNGSQAGENTP
jgi:hypothetical protein